MTERKEIWGLATPAFTAIVQNVSPKVQEAIQESPFKDIPGWFHIGTAFYMRPEPLTVELLRVRNPYNHRETQEKAIHALTEAGLIDDKGVITQASVDAYQKLIDIQNTGAADLDNMAEDDLRRLADYLKRAYKRALKLSEPPVPCLKNASRLDLPETALVRVFYIISRMNAFRDDCHLAAWKPLGIDGNTFEALSLVWDESADSAAKLLEARQNRGYEEADWQTTLDKLVEKGWLKQDGDVYKTSDEGQKIRDEIEVKTDEYFYQAFDVLSDEEVDELVTLLKAVQEKFTPEPEPEA